MGTVGGIANDHVLSELCSLWFIPITNTGTASRKDRENDALVSNLQVSSGFLHGNEDIRRFCNVFSASIISFGVG